VYFLRPYYAPFPLAGPPVPGLAGRSLDDAKPFDRFDKSPAARGKPGDCAIMSRPIATGTCCDQVTGADRRIGGRVQSRLPINQRAKQARDPLQCFVVEKFLLTLSGYSSLFHRCAK
jgi:hypothetical protein